MANNSNFAALLLIGALAVIIAVMLWNRSPQERFPSSSPSLRPCRTDCLDGCDKEGVTCMKACGPDNIPCYNKCSKSSVKCYKDCGWPCRPPPQERFGSVGVANPTRDCGCGNAEAMCLANCNPGDRGCAQSCQESVNDCYRYCTS